jgi:hypothetical protein
MARIKQTARQTTGLNAARDRSLVAKAVPGDKLVSQIQSLSNELTHPAHTFWLLCSQQYA